VKVWFEVISDLFVNIAAAWFVAAFIETQFYSFHSQEDIFLLLFKILNGILSLFAAKYLREKSRRK